MLLRTYKFLLILGLVFVFIASPVFLWAYPSRRNLEIDYLDIGQGDASLIKAPGGENILIDGGPDSKIISCLSEELSWWDRTIDLMILTHPHDDHVSGLIDVLNTYEVKKIVYTGVLHNSPNFLAWLNLIKEKKISMIIIEKEQKIDLGEDCFLEFLYPDQALFEKRSFNLNNTSIINRLECENKTFLFTGDMEEDLENYLLEKGVDLKADVLKVGHHGSETSSTENFLKAVDPQFAIIEVGLNNSFNHPSRRVLKRFEKIKTYRTDLNGTVRVFVDCDVLKIKARQE